MAKRWVDLCTLVTESEKFMQRPSLGSVPCTVQMTSTTRCSQDCIPENVSHGGNGGQNVHSEDRGGSEKPLITRVQLVGQSAVTFPWWSFPMPKYGFKKPVLWLWPHREVPFFPRVFIPSLGWKIFQAFIKTPKWLKFTLRYYWLMSDLESDFY